MRDRITSTAVIVAMILALFPSGTAKAGIFEEDYVVHYICPLGPQPPDPIGMWHVDCAGNWTGWGMRPGDGCTSYDTYQGNECL